MTDFADDTPMALDEAAEVLLRGLVTASTLRAAIDRKDLACERIGRRIVVTPADIRAWQERCRTLAVDTTSTSSRGPTARRPGTSAMADSGSQQAATSAMLTELAARSKSTSGKRRDRP